VVLGEGPFLVVVVDFAGSSAWFKVLCRPTYNLRFGGTKAGWIGERSVPTTLASGNSTAKSLRGQLPAVKAPRVTYMAHIPVPVPKSSAFFTLSFSSGAKKSFPSSASVQT
jgi:hypothetical protein